MPWQRKLQCLIQTPWVLCSSKWIERECLPGGSEVIGLNPVGDSDFFLCPTLVTCWSFHFHICFIELKIYHLSFFESCNVFWSIKFVQFTNIGLQILNWWHVFQVVYAIWAIKHFKTFQCQLVWVGIVIIKYFVRLLCYISFYRALFQFIHSLDFSGYQWRIQGRGPGGPAPPFFGDRKSPPPPHLMVRRNKLHNKNTWLL